MTPIRVAPSTALIGMKPPGVTGAQSNERKRLMKVGKPPSALSSELISPMPKKSRPNPRTVSPHPRTADFFAIIIRKPIATHGRAIPPRLNEISCAVTVVPIFAPKMIPTAC